MLTTDFSVTLSANSIRQRKERPLLFVQFSVKLIKVMIKCFLLAAMKSSSSKSSCSNSTAIAICR